MPEIQSESGKNQADEQAKADKQVKVQEEASKELEEKKNNSNTTGDSNSTIKEVINYFNSWFNNNNTDNKTK